MSDVEAPCVVVMGVSGCGKSTVGALLADELSVPFVDADSLHPPHNLAKMGAGIPLDDDDRWPWLAAVAAELRDHEAGVVVACSALRRRYRDALRRGAPGVAFVHLVGPRPVLGARMAARTSHFMPASMLDSQLATLEPLEPGESGVVLDVTATPLDVAQSARAWLSSRVAAAPPVR